MRNTWKGMILGTLTGAAVGLVLDSLDRAAQGAGNAAHAAPDVASRATGRARQRAMALLHDSAGRTYRATRWAANSNGHDRHAAMR